MVLTGVSCQVCFPSRRIDFEGPGNLSGSTFSPALFLAGRGHDVWGVDSAPAAIEIARRKAEERGLAATFLVKDTLNLHEIGRTFDTFIDSGLFHTLSDPDRPCFVRNLSEVLKPGGTYFMLAFSEREPGEYGPAGSQKRRYRLPFLMGGQSMRSGPRSLRAAQGRKALRRGCHRSLGSDVSCSSSITRENF